MLPDDVVAFVVVVECRRLSDADDDVVVPEEEEATSCDRGGLDVIIIFSSPVLLASWAEKGRSKSCPVSARAIDC